MKKPSFFLIISDDRLNDLDFWDDDLTAEFNSNSGTKSHDSTEILVSAANLDSKSNISAIENILEDNSHLPNLDIYVESVYDSIRECFGDTVADLFMLDYTNNDECTTVEAAKYLFTDTATEIFSFASVLCDAISFDFDEGYDGSKLASIINTFSVTISPRILYRPIPAILKSTGEIVYCDAFSANSTISALYLCFVLTVRDKKQIRRCRVCGKYFVPSVKINEMYCGNCRKTTYDTKIKQDEVLSAYRTIYKTQNARKQRNSHRPHIEDKFEKWKGFAKLKLQQCKNQEISLEEMKKAISSDRWINDTL